jgi:hypothetical protein
MVQAINLYGSGPNSSFTNVQTSTAPVAPVAPVLTYSTGVVTVTWSEPSELNGADLNSYQIEFLNKSSGTYVSITQCDGTSVSVVTSRTCSLVMSLFTSTLGYLGGQTIHA